MREDERRQSETPKLQKASVCPSSGLTSLLFVTLHVREAVKLFSRNQFSLGLIQMKYRSPEVQQAF